MFINISPLKQYRDFRLLFFGQMISFLGSMVSYVAIPYQVYELTKDNWLVGMLGLVQLGPVLIFGILGGTYADRLDRRKLLLVSEFFMSLMILGLTLNAWSDQPSIPLIFILVALFQSILGFHRPAMDALTQKIVDKKDYAAVGALGSFRYSAGAIVGPALGGILIASFGIKGAYLFDFISFVAAFIALYLMSKIPNPEKRDNSPWTDAKEGLKYAVSKPELIGTYLIDIVAMAFAFPVALFPSMSEKWGGASAAGLLFSAMAVGSLIMTVFSGWTAKVSRHGKAVVIAATLWAVFIVGVGYAQHLWVALLFLGLAGAADMMSGLFRGIIWNETVPNELRGRLSGIEMISYMSGPLLGNARAGWMAAKVSVPFSISAGGAICAVAVIVTAFCLPKFWRYHGHASHTS
ncbi:MAG: MFS transporter [Bdellovibrio sp. ArHS]|uniref:MFS transporter n=1 Tax=Bdellovibrio sp. ArHS TaxID=1569284 RepID=UPI0005829A48|nr:MFS transporter [Bdellovibrio sp. ArHS]KHD87629.1 MAG: MFS transporter [Bdellovibrio sp. ArHS]